MFKLSSALRIGCLLVALMFAAYQVGLAPHLVHHLLDHDLAQLDCPFAMAAERQHASPTSRHCRRQSPRQPSSQRPYQPRAI